MIDALITAGGRGTRMKDMEWEKPLIDILGRPMIDRVVDALIHARSIGTVYASVSDNAPLTRAHLERKGIETIETSGTGYVADLGQAMGRLRSSSVLVCPADMPLLNASAIDAVAAAFDACNVASLSVAVALEMVRAIGAAPSFTLDVEGREVVLCGVSVVDREQMLSGEMLSQGYMVTEDESFALNVNTREDMRCAEQLLLRRSGD